MGIRQSEFNGKRLSLGIWFGVRDCQQPRRRNIQCSAQVGMAIEEFVEKQVKVLAITMPALAHGPDRTGIRYDLGNFWLFRHGKINVIAALGLTQARSSANLCLVNKKVVVVDNYDSFTYNLVQYIGTLGAQTRVYLNDKADCRVILQEIPREYCFRRDPAHLATPESHSKSLRNSGEEYQYWAFVWGTNRLARHLAVKWYAPNV